MRISTGVLDPVYATALLIEDGKDLVCFVTLDAVVIRNFLVDKVRAVLDRDFGKGLFTVTAEE